MADETSPKPFDPTALLAAELTLPANAIAAVLALLGDGATVPFIARYRKEATGGLDEVQIRTIEERRDYLVELDARRETMLASIQEQGKLTPALAAKLRAATTKQALEDLYLPYKQKRRTKAAVARERGLGPLAERVLAQGVEGELEGEAAAFVDASKELPDVDAVLAGVSEILVEAVVEQPEVRAMVRRHYGEQGVLEASEVAGANPAERGKFEDWLEWSEPAAKMPSHRYLAIRRGEQAGVLRSKILVEPELVQGAVEERMGLDERSPYAPLLRRAVKKALRGRLAVGVETDVRVELKQRADREAVDVFASNLENLLLAAPLGSCAVIGIDPGLRTGCKCAAVDATGKFLATQTIYPVRDEARAGRELAAFVRLHRPRAIAVGNGTGGRETEALTRSVVAELRAELSAEGGEAPIVISVNEAGASVYSASEVAREEFPDLDLTIRGAISIARRLQDPLAELVKIDPKSIGVGQYQHDVQQTLLGRKLHEVVESCVNRVGVELNTASAPLLAYVAGVGHTLARKIVSHRERVGPFASRAALLEVPGLGPKTFEQAAGFLRVRESAEVLDRSAVHPERYELVARMATDLGVPLERLVGDAELAKRIELRRYVSEAVGEPTLRDIIAELAKPGRDPRAEFEAPNFRDDVRELEDLEIGMELEGVVTNVTRFGAFVDLGVHQDGLVHVSELSDRWVDDPAKVVKVGDRLKVRVLSVDLERKRVGLSARKGGPKGGQASAGGARGQDRGGGGGGGGSRERAGERGGARSEGGRGRKQGGRRNHDEAGFKNNPFAKLRR
ncbi:RNA-binding transcriptional accessory protein [Pseudenhygromyxa sp. WMMC2535]|uniref:Tex family protein n=1 Tax=Pseudenhygromyxa sp. WMMC2535 TaxID=2712867 RepID=UPI001557A7E1|nr:Tex family protein [Pseudenhygromyxa sp. WMMC2535]NVB38231.1 RNA-binding transcriptional accessory protein [Pseudenhygromyxa sp. WMMC2535]NVB43586.1 RNA-binding transcriptional accessory protein [Pseudenhygromyxa sp. WMMC2535]